MPTSDHGHPVADLSDEQLAQLRRDVLHEQSLRRRLDASPEKINRVTREYQAASGVKDGDQWTFPTSPLLRPMEGARRRHNGKMWRSTIDHNIWEPGVSGWVLEPEVDPETGETIYPPFVRPSGAHDAYREGWRITGEDGNIYAAARDGVDWPPEVAPEDWILVEEEPEPEPPEDEEPDPEEPTDPEEPGDDDEDDEPEPEPEPDEPALPEWKTDVDYQPGDRFTYQGHEYTVLQAHTSAAHWPPSQVASLYERQG